jgi:hypothetical protein
LYRTVERRLGKPYRRQGQTTRKIAEGFQLYLSVPRAASFAVSLRVGRSEQLKFEGFDVAAQVVDEFLDCMDLFGRQKFDTLRDRIPQEDYFLNFVGLARKLSPDGEEVNFVGLTGIKDGQFREVSLTRSQGQLSLPSARIEKGESSIQHYEGSLKGAEAIKENQIKIKLNKGRPITITVPEGLMDDIVRPMWGTDVRVSATRRRGKLVLLDIKKSEKEAGS